MDKTDKERGPRPVNTKPNPWRIEHKAGVVRLAEALGLITRQQAEKKYTQLEFEYQELLDSDRWN